MNIYLLFYDEYIHHRTLLLPTFTLFEVGVENRYIKEKENNVFVLNF